MKCRNLQKPFPVKKDATIIFRAILTGGEGTEKGRMDKAKRGAQLWGRNQPGCH